MQGLNLGDEVISCGEVISEREMNRIYEISRMAPSRLLALCYVLYDTSLNHGYICIGKVFYFYLATFHRRTILSNFLPEEDA